MFFFISELNLIKKITMAPLSRLVDLIVILVSVTPLCNVRMFELLP